MLRRMTSFVCCCLWVAAILDCGKKNPEITETASPSDKLPPRGSASDAPEFVRSLSLLYPQAEIYRVDQATGTGRNPGEAAAAGRASTILQKTNHRVKDIIAYYEAVFKKHNFSETARLEQNESALLQYERSAKETTELISVDISKLPYAENFLIRIGRSEVDYSRGKKAAAENE
ncbi:MAG: hypothetical protein KF713_09805 [Turneriella sp.]|nr:hypothetical protein [Turneriella sp.]